MASTPLRISLDLAVSSEARSALARARGQIVSLVAPTGLSRNSLSRKFNGLSSFTVGELGAVARALGLTAADLVARAEAAVAASPSDTPPATEVSTAGEPGSSRLVLVPVALAAVGPGEAGPSEAELEAHVEACDACTCAQDALEHARQSAEDVA